MDRRKAIIGSILLLGLFYLFAQVNGWDWDEISALSDKIQNDRQFAVITAAAVTVGAVITAFSYQTTPEKPGTKKAPSAIEAEVDAVLDDIESCESCSVEQFADDDTTESKEPVCQSKEVGEGGDGEVTLYYTSWCGYSIQFLSHWNEVLKRVSSDSRYNGIKFVQICCEGSDKSKCSGVPGFPTVRFSQGNHTHNYNGNRTADDLIAEIESFFRL